MKYVFLGILFFCLGYFIPTLPMFFQYVAVTVVVGAAIIAAWFYIETTDWSRLLEVLGEE